ncbi:hypothetical protein HHK36_007182 [Tetracentron sinense]|uniref:Thioredoxin domain-containing protein n=1 Tax=Tetracentron sinense TaxID=13715 RepID=A0A834ZKG8_TETSI|nr:hypothetical protein HHK36_007182 [Tetracentron sinense]
MKCLSWNCQGLGNPWTIRNLHNIVKKEDPWFVFLMETRLKKQDMEKIKVSLGFSNAIVVESVGRSGGLCLLWRQDLDISLQSYSKNHIDVVLGTVGEREVWRLTGMYGHPEAAKKWETWELIRYLSRSYSMPWVCFGDFNEITCAEEKSGRVEKAAWKMRKFKEAILDCHLIGLGFEGNTFTWCNKRSGEGNVRERLDRAMATSDWCFLFPFTTVKHLSCHTSDHSPLLLAFDKEAPKIARKKRSFRFEAMWIHSPECAEIIDSAWTGCHQVSAQVLPRDAKVSLLIDKDQKTWNHTLLMTVFMPHEAELISSIPLSERLPPDKRVWHFTSKGFSVRSAYHLTSTLRDRESATSSSTSSLSWNGSLSGIKWSQVWQLAIPPKVKIFIWKVALNILPVRANLCKRKIPVENVCGVCGEEGETILHVLKNCHYARQVWLLSQLGLRSDATSADSLSSWVEEIMKSHGEEGLSAFFMIAWSIWKHRNEYIFSGVKMTPFNCVQRANKLLADFHNANDRAAPESISAARSWLAPPGDLFKVNIDGALHLEDRSAGVGVVVRDHNGDLIAAMSKRISNTQSAAVIEAIAAREGLKFALELGIQEVILESDSVNTIRALTSQEENSSFENLVLDDRKKNREEKERMGSVISALQGGGSDASSSEPSRVVAFHSTALWKAHFDSLKESTQLMVVDFSASWCGPCRLIEPAFKELAAKFTDVEFAKIDVDELVEVAQEYAVQAMPTFILIKQGKEVDKVVGAKKDELHNKIQKHRA